MKRVVEFTVGNPLLLLVLATVLAGTPILAGDRRFLPLITYLLWYSACFALHYSHLQDEDEEPDDDPGDREPIVQFPTGRFIGDGAREYREAA